MMDTVTDILTLTSNVFLYGSQVLNDYTKSANICGSVGLHLKNVKRFQIV